MVAGELPLWPHLPELPARGPGADMVGRAMGLLCEVSGEFAVATGSQGWQRSAAPGRDMRRAAAMLQADLDTAAEVFAGYRGTFGVSVAGPWTLLGTIVDQWGERSLRDRGFAAELCAAHADACVGLLRRVQAVLPGAAVVLVLDEPLLAAVHAGSLPFSSGYRRHAAASTAQLVGGLRPIGDAVRADGAALGVHTCAAPVWSVFEALRPDWLSLDVTLLAEQDSEHFGRWLESGAGTVWGVWPTLPDESQPADLVTDWLARLGFAPTRLPAPMAVSPSCGLAGSTREHALGALRGCRDLAKRLAEDEG